MRTLQLISSGGVYGAERMLVSLSRALKRLGCQPVIGVFQDARAPHTEVAGILREDGFTVAMIPCRGRWDRQTVGAIRDCVRKHRIDLVHTHGYKADIYGFLAARGVRTPVLATCHNWTNANTSLKFYSCLDRWILRYFDGMVSVSDDLTLRLKRSGIPAHKIAAIGNGVSVERYRSAEPSLSNAIRKPDHLVVGVVARMMPQKGISTLLEAAGRILPSFPQTMFVMVGDGPYRSAFEAQAEQLGIGNHVVFTGWRDDMPGLYRSLDIFALPSLNEGLPMSVLEAMAAGVAVVATPVGALKTVIRDGDTGLLVEPGNVESLGNALARLLSDRELRAHLGQQGQQHVQAKHSAEAMARQYLDVYEQALKHRAKDPSLLLSREA